MIKQSQTVNSKQNRLKRKIIAIVGPTASGKTDLAIFLAKKYDCELISADSRQVFRKMDIGTGKDKSYPQHLIDIRDPMENYSVAEYQSDAYKIIFDIFKKKKIPILVGGTGLYIDAVLKGYEIPKTSLKLREELSHLTNVEILAQLKSYDPASYEKIDHNNRRRILRALESSIVNRRPFSEVQAKKPNFNLLIIGIDLPRKKLYERIDERVDKRLKQGMVEEVEHLLKSGVTYERMQNFGLEYRFISNYLKNPTPENFKLEITNLKFKTHAFARRQLTWFRRNKDIRWVKNQKEAEQLIRKFLGR